MRTLRHMAEGGLVRGTEGNASARAGDLVAISPTGLAYDALRAEDVCLVTAEGELVLQGQRYRDQAKNIEDCRDKLRQMILQALHVPKPRRPTKPTRGSKERRLDAKRRQSQRKAARKHGGEE